MSLRTFLSRWFSRSTESPKKPRKFDPELEAFLERVRKEYREWYGREMPENYQPVDNPVTRAGHGWDYFVKVAKDIPRRGQELYDEAEAKKKP